MCLNCFDLQDNVIKQDEMAYIVLENVPSLDFLGLLVVGLLVFKWSEM